MTLFTGPIEKMEWATDKSKQTLNVEAATRLYGMSIHPEEDKMLDIIKNNPLFE